MSIILKTMLTVCIVATGWIGVANAQFAMPSASLWSQPTNLPAPASVYEHRSVGAEPSLYPTEKHVRGHRKMNDIR
jgi:hypothetical protein